MGAPPFTINAAGLGFAVIDDKLAIVDEGGVGLVDVSRSVDFAARGWGFDPLRHRLVGPTDGDTLAIDIDSGAVVDLPPLPGDIVTVTTDFAGDGIIAFVDDGDARTNVFRLRDADWELLAAGVDRPSGAVLVDSERQRLIFSNGARATLIDARGVSTTPPFQSAPIRIVAVPRSKSRSHSFNVANSNRLIPVE